MKAEKVDEHLKAKLKDPYFAELHALEQQKLEIVKKILNFRIKQGLSQRQLAEKANVSQQHISKVETGDFSNVATLEKILLYIGYTIRLNVVPLSASKFRKIERRIAKSRLKAA